MGSKSALNAQKYTQAKHLHPWNSSLETSREIQLLFSMISHPVMSVTYNWLCFELASFKVHAFLGRVMNYDTVLVHITQGRTLPTVQHLTVRCNYCGHGHSEHMLLLLHHEKLHTSPRLQNTCTLTSLSILILLTPHRDIHWSVNTTATGFEARTLPVTSVSRVVK